MSRRVFFNAPRLISRSPHITNRLTNLKVAKERGGMGKILLCCLEGLTRAEAAARLGWRMGTLQSRLARGRERLKGQLIKRGLAPGMGIAAAIFSEQGSRAAV